MDRLQDIAKFISESGRDDDAYFLYRMILCIDPQNAEALCHIGLLAIRRNLSGNGAAWVIRAVQLGGAAGLSRTALLDAVNLAYREALDLSQTERHRPEIALANLTVLASTVNELRVLYAAVVCLAAALGRHEMAISWCINGLRMEMDEESLASILKAGLYLVSNAKVNDVLVAEMGRISSDFINRDRGFDVCYFSVLYQKYWEGDDVASQELAKNFRKILGDAGFLTNNILNSWHLCRYDDAFFGALPASSELSSVIGPLRHEQMLPPGDGPVILISCDARYLELLGTKLLDSACVVGAIQAVHLHVINPTPASYEIIKTFERREGCIIGLSTENASGVRAGSAIHKNKDLMKTYYACARFIRLPEIARLYHRPIAQIDTDCLLISNISRLPICNSDEDIGFLHDGIKTGPARQFNATFFFLNNHQKSYEYAALLARYVAHFIAFDIPFWGLDQAALYCVYQYMRRQGQAPSAGTTPSWELFEHIFPSGDDSLDGKIHKLEARLAALAAAHRDAGPRPVEALG